MKPIIFSTPMVQAILDNRKRHTRRVVPVDNPDEFEAHNDCRKKGGYGADVPCYLVRKKATEERGIFYPRHDVGDILWVRETWWEYDGKYHYAADYALGGKQLCKGIKLRPSIHMPREAARIFLKVKNVRVERLQEITEEDAKAEGVTPFPYNSDGDCWTDGKYRTAFEYLWNQIHGWYPNAWAKNPWVWVYEFRREVE